MGFLREIASWVGGRLSSWKFRIQAMPDCQEASEIKKKLEILDRHLQLDMIFCSRRAEGLAFLMVLRFREPNRKIILLHCWDVMTKPPRKWTWFSPKITQLKRKIIFHPPPFRQEATKIAEETALCHGGESRGVGAPTGLSFYVQGLLYAPI